MCIKVPIYFSIKHISSKNNHIFNHEIKKDALQEFKKSLAKFSNLLDDLNGENPLPASIIFTAESEEIINKTIESYSKNQNIEYIQYDQEIVARVQQ